MHNRPNRVASHDNEQLDMERTQKTFLMERRLMRKKRGSLVSVGAGTKNSPARIQLCLAVFLMMFPVVADSAAPETESVFRNSLGMTFVRIPAGTYQMGSPPGESHRNGNEILHEVTLSKPYFMQTTEVTLEQWWSVMGKQFFGQRKGEPNSPVVKVSWHDCKNFIKKLNALEKGTYRLPSEAQWEYACRAGTGKAYFWGDDLGCGRAMYGNKRFRSEECIDYAAAAGLPVNGPAPVKNYQPNAWGLYDMHGNVWEWCEDWYGDYPDRPVVDPKGPDSGPGRIRRGGSWFSDEAACRCANRAYGHASARYQTTGFRLVREIE